MDFEFLDDWEDRYRHGDLIWASRKWTRWPSIGRFPRPKVDGCASQVMVAHAVRNGVLAFFRRVPAMR